MEAIEDVLRHIDGYLGAAFYFPYVLLGVGLIFTLYLGFPQIRYFKRAWGILFGRHTRKDAEGDTTHFQALSTALSGTVGTGNIAGVALAIHLGGPAALFWMWATAFVGMTTKFVEVTVSHKYRVKDDQGEIAGGPMYYMEHGLNMKWLAVLFAILTVASTLGSGNMPQADSLSSGLNSSFGIPPWLSGGVLAILLGVVIVGGIRVIARVASAIVPLMGVIYAIGAFAVVASNIEAVGPAFLAVFSDAFTGSAAGGGFLGASLAFALNKGVNRGLFSNEAGPGLRAHSARLRPCRRAGFRGHGLAPGTLHRHAGDLHVDGAGDPLLRRVAGEVRQRVPILRHHVRGRRVHGCERGRRAGAALASRPERRTAAAGDRRLRRGERAAGSRRRHHPAQPFGGGGRGLPARRSTLQRPDHLAEGRLQDDLALHGKSLLHSVPLTVEAFKRSFFGVYGQYAVTIGLVLFAFSTAIAWSYYGDRAMTYLFGHTRYVLIYRLAYVLAFFLAAFVDTSLVWLISAITLPLMALPNLLGILLLRREMKQAVRDYWRDA